MFRRVLYENWHNLVPVVAFFLTFAVFMVALIRALLMRKDTASAMSLLPLDDGLIAQAQAKAGTSVVTETSAAQPHREPCQGDCKDCCCSRTK